MSDRFEDILEKCICQVLDEGRGVEECLADHPEEAARLEPLLQVALTMKKGAARLEPRPEFKAGLKAMFVAAQPPEKRKTEWRWPSALSLSRWWVVAAGSVLVVLLSGGGVVAASGNSLPDQPLYAVKTATEQATVVLTPSQAKKAELHARFARERMREIALLAKKGKIRAMNTSISRFEENMGGVSFLRKANKLPAEIRKLSPAEKARLKAVLQRDAARNRAMLEAVLREAPPEAVPALRLALRRAVLSYEEAIKALAESRWE